MTTKKKEHRKLGEPALDQARTLDIDAIEKISGGTLRTDDRSQDKTHEKEVQVLSWSFGETQGGY